MSTITDIEASIRALSPADCERLADDLPSILPELNGDLKWQGLAAESRPRPALTALGDEIAAQLKENSPAFGELKDADFDRAEVKSFGTL